jgi:nuclear pore complex protein Nup54
MFGAQSSSSLFGTPSSTPAFGTPTFGTPSSTPAFGTPGFGTPSSTPAFGASSTPAFGGSSLFSSPFSSQQQPQQQQQQQQSSLFQQSPSTGFGFQNSLTTPQPASFPNSQLTTQMANVAPVPFSLADRDIQVYIFFSLYSSNWFQLI